MLPYQSSTAAREEPWPTPFEVWVRLARTHCEFGRLHYPKNPLFLGCELDILGWTSSDAPDIGRASALINEIETHEGFGDLNNRWHYRRMLVASIAAQAGLTDSTTAILQNAERDPNRLGSSRHWPMQKAYVELLVGDTARSLHLLREYLEANPQRRSFVGKHAWFEPLRNRQEFVRMTGTTRAN